MSNNPYFLRVPYFLRDAHHPMRVCDSDDGGIPVNTQHVLSNIWPFAVFFSFERSSIHSEVPSQPMFCVRKKVTTRKFPLPAETLVFLSGLG